MMKISYKKCNFNLKLINRNLLRKKFDIYCCLIYICYTIYNILLFLAQFLYYFYIKNLIIQA